MERSVRQNRLVENSWIRLSTVLLSGSLALTACGRGGTEGNNGVAAGSSTSVSAAPLQSGVLPKLVFDDLHGGSPLIQVYSGVTESPADRRANGSFNDGDTVPAECRMVGRMVHSNPALGEEDRSSDDWIRIQGSPGETQYATAVYVENPDALLDSLPGC